MPKSEKDIRQEKREATIALIDEIKRALQAHDMSLMVGCGFSRNADQIDRSLPKPPLWNELNSIIVNALHPELDDKAKKDEEKKTTIRLAGEYEAVKGHPALDKLIKNNLHDENLKPGDLHMRLMDLPWTAIYTTNYDSLLEKTNSLCSSRYTLVDNIKKISCSTPMLIKLHGSVSGTMPLIITQNDYSNYESKYQAFVNEVEHSLVHHSMCLIGFSGDDPNFENWRNWAFNAAQNHKPAYLISLNSKIDSEIQLLKNNGIKFVDLSLFDPSQDNSINSLQPIPNFDSRDDIYKKKLSTFFTYLQNYDAKESDIETKDVKPVAKEEFIVPLHYDIYHPQMSYEYLSPRQNDKEKLQKTIEYWSSERKKIQGNGNVLLDYRDRATLVAMTEQWGAIAKILLDDKVGSPWDIRGIYEYNWRMEQCLMPIWNDIILQYEIILKCYNPYNLSYFCNEGAQKICPEPQETALQDMWRSLCFAILRWSREEHDFERHKIYQKILQEISEGNSEYHNRLCYEKALFALSIPDFITFNTAMDEWKKLEKSPEWLLKYATTLAETGDFSQAESMIRDARKQIDSFIESKSSRDNYNLLGYVLVCQSMIEQNLADTKVDTDAQKRKEECQNILNDLQRIHCNPWEELEYFKHLLDCPEIIQQIKKKIRLFDYTTGNTIFYNGWPKQLTLGFQLIRYLEETGLLLHFDHYNLANDTLSGAIQRIASSSPHLAFSYLHRSGTGKWATVENLFSQQIMYQKKPEESNCLLEQYIPAAEYIMKEKTASLIKEDNTYFCRCFKNLLDAISRLTVKADDEHLKSVLNLYLEFYEKDIGRKFIVYGKFQSYMRRTFEAMSPHAIFQNLPRILNIALPDNDMQRLGWSSPICSINWRNFSMSPKECSAELVSVINSWIERLAANDPFIVTHTLSVINCCIDLGILTKIQKGRIEKLYWDATPEKGLPPRGNFYAWACSKFTFSAGGKKKFHHRLVDFMKASDFHFYQKDGEHISWGPRTDNAFKELANSILVSFSVTERDKTFFFKTPTDLPAAVLKKIQTVWKDSKQNLTKIVSGANPWDRDLAEGIKENLLLFDRIIAEFLIPNFTANRQSMSGIKRLLNEMEQIQPFPSSRISLSDKRNRTNETLRENFLKAFTQNDPHIFRLYSIAIENAYAFARFNKGPVYLPSEILNCLLHSVSVRRDKNFLGTCGTLGLLIRQNSLSQADKEILSLYLESLLNETSFNCPESQFPLEERFDYRLHAAYLAAELYKTYSNKDTVPRGLAQWREACISSNEFPVLRNQWNETAGR